MEPKTTSQESPTAGKGGETTAHASPAAATPGQTQNLSSDAVTGLLASAFAEAEPAAPATPAPGEEVQPAAGSESDVTTEETPTPESGAEESPDAQTGELPAEVLAQVTAWEEAGGALPPALQGIVDGRIKRELTKVKDLETRAETAEARVAELKAGGHTVPAPVLDTVEQFNARVDASRKFLKAARPFLGGYATDEQKAGMEQFMSSKGLDENALRQYVDEVNDWLTTDAPLERNRIQAFREQEQAAEPIVAKLFPSLAKKETEEAKFAAEIQKLVPELRTRTAGHKLAVATFVLGKIAAEHLKAALPEGDLVAALKTTLTKGAPIPSKTPNGKPAALPGKAPVKTPTGSPLGGTRTATTRQTELDAASQKLNDNLTADNVTDALKIALR